jgi:hypothetical protein
LPHGDAQLLFYGLAGGSAFTAELFVAGLVRVDGEVCLREGFPVVWV